MKIHLITVGEPKLPYAASGWQEYLGRLKHYHTIRVTHVPDKFAYDTKYLAQVAGTAHKIALVIDGKQLTSTELATFLDKRALDAREICLMIGGPEGLPAETIRTADTQLSLSRLTFPHDLAMVIVVEALYRASMIQSGRPYHK